MNTVALFGVLELCSALSPGNATTLATPGIDLAMALIFSVTACVRSSEAPSGSSAPANRYCLSWIGMNPAGTARNASTATTSITA